MLMLSVFNQLVMSSRRTSRSFRPHLLVLEDHSVPAALLPGVEVETAVKSDAPAETRPADTESQKMVEQNGAILAACRRLLVKKTT